MMIRPRVHGCALAAFTATLVFGTVASAQSVTVSKCAAAKTRCVMGKTHQCGVAGVRGLFSCYERAAIRSNPVDPECFTLTVTEIRECFRQAEKRDDCITTGDADAIQERIAAYVLDVVRQLDPTHPALITNRCLVNRLRTVGEATAAKLGCFDEAFRWPPGIVDPACFTRSQDRFSYLWGKIEDTSDCVTTDDGTGLEVKMDDFVADVVTALDPANPQ